jgi:hypothetical protein
MHSTESYTLSVIDEVVLLSVDGTDRVEYRLNYGFCEMY